MTGFVSTPCKRWCKRITNAQRADGRPPFVQARIKRQEGQRIKGSVNVERLWIGIDVHGQIEIATLRRAARNLRAAAIYGVAEYVRITVHPKNPCLDEFWNVARDALGAASIEAVDRPSEGCLTMVVSRDAPDPLTGPDYLVVTSIESAVYTRIGTLS